jgi:hypothetical protein
VPECQRIVARRFARGRSYGRLSGL